MRFNSHQSEIAIDPAKLSKVLSDGPMRFCPSKPQPAYGTPASIQGLTPAQHEHLQRLHEEYDELEDEILIRLVQCEHPQVESCLRNNASKHLKTTVSAISHLLHSKAILVCPGLTTKHDPHPVLYMKPSLFTQNTHELVKYWVYMLRAVTGQSRVSILINMREWTMKDYSVHVWSQFLQALQGHLFPVDVRNVWFVDAPAWFNSIARMIQRIMVTDEFFRERLQQIKTDELKYYVNDVDFLPDELIGSVNTNALSFDFVCYRLHLEKLQKESKREKDQLTKTLSMRRLSPTQSPRRSLMARAFSQRNMTTPSPRKTSRPGLVKAMSSRVMGLGRPPLEHSPTKSPMPKEIHFTGMGKPPLVSEDSSPATKPKEIHDTPPREYTLNFVEDKSVSTKQLSVTGTDDQSVDSGVSLSMYFD